jgi:hypothetical protein
VEETADGTSVRWELFTSRVLDGNPLGDPVTRRLPVLLPPGYDADSDRRYPVIYGLTGYTGRGELLLHVRPWNLDLHARLERLYASGMPPAIVVLPDCFTRFGGSQYVNSSATGRYEDYLTQELVPFISAAGRFGSPSITAAVMFSRRTTPTHVRYDVI